MTLQWEECCGEYRSKRAVYFRLHQEMQDTKIKMKGLQQVRNFIRVMVWFCICAIFDGTRWFRRYVAVFGLDADLLATCSACDPKQH